MPFGKQLTRLEKAGWGALAASVVVLWLVRIIPAFCGLGGRWWDTSSMGILIGLILHWLRGNRRNVGKMVFSRQIPQEAAFIPRHVWDHRFVAASS